MDNEQYLNEVREALENDPNRIGDVWRLTNKGKSATEIAEELRLETSQYVERNQTYIRAIEKGVLPTSAWIAGKCRDTLRSFLKRHRENFSAETIRILEKRVTKCDRRTNNRQVVQKSAESKKETSQAEEALEKSDIAGIYVYTYPKYYNNPDVEKMDDTDARIKLKIGMSEKDAFKRVMQQKTGMPERPMILQIWKVENDSDLREVEKKIHEHLRKAGHVDHYSEGREWFLTNEQFVASTANLIGLELYYERNPETDD